MRSIDKMLCQHYHYCLSRRRMPKSSLSSLCQLQFLHKLILNETIRILRAALSVCEGIVVGRERKENAYDDAEGSSSNADTAFYQCYD